MVSHWIRWNRWNRPFCTIPWHKFDLPDPWKSLCFSVTSFRMENFWLLRITKKSNVWGPNILCFRITSLELFCSNKHVSYSIPRYIIIPAALYLWFRRIFAEISALYRLALRFLREFNANNNIRVYGSLLQRRNRIARSKLCTECKWGYKKKGKEEKNNDFIK